MRFVWNCAEMKWFNEKPYLKFLLVIIVLLMVYQFIYLFTQIDDSTQQNLHSFVVFKLPRSGSTWFTELLNSHDDVYVTKEIIQTKDVLKNYSSSYIQTFLSQALNYPSPKLTFAHWKYLSGRFRQDYIYSWKFLRHLQIVGFTLNPEHVSKIKWSFLQGHPNVYIIILVRTNIVKTAISDYTGVQLKARCGMNNLKKSSTTRNRSNLDLHIPSLLQRSKMVTLQSSQQTKPYVHVCESMNTSIPWTYEDFEDYIIKWSSRYYRFYERIHRILIESSSPSIKKILIVRYESVQQNSTYVMSQLLSHITHKNTYSSYGISKYNSGSTYESSWKKRNTENISSILLHYDTIKHILRTLSEQKSSPSVCTCLYEQFISSQIKTFNHTCLYYILNGFCLSTTTTSTNNTKYDKYWIRNPDNIFESFYTHHKIILI